MQIFKVYYKIRSLGNYLTLSRISMLQVNQLTYERNDSEIFSQLDFSVAAGQLLHISGENGAGKTTLIRILAGLLTPSAGEIKWQGKCIKKFKHDFIKAMLCIGHLNGIKHGLTVEENLSLFTALGIPDKERIAAEILHHLNLSNKQNCLVSDLSAGQKRRLALAKLFICQATLWLLDEPFTSLDGQGKFYLEQEFVRHLQTGGIIVVTSHLEIYSKLETKNYLRLSL